jgi:hypothetical protein
VSNYRSIAVVTAAIRNRLVGVCGEVLSAAQVTTLRPDATPTDLPTVGVNIFLYQITVNPALRNADLPTRRSDGSIIKHPTAAIDLHYLLSFYGQDQRFESQILLGAVASDLHANPNLSRTELEQVFSASALGQSGSAAAATQGDPTISELTVPNQEPLFDPSGMADAVDLVRFTPTELSLEELSKLWSVFLDTPYVLSTIYQAGPVLIEDSTATVTAAALPVMLPPRVHVIAANPPSIEQVSATTGAGSPIVANSTLMLVGTFFSGSSTTVLIDGVAVLTQNLPPAPPNAPRRPQRSITGIPLPAALASGTHSVQVTQQLPTGQASHPSQTIVSNMAGFVLQPTIQASSVDGSNKQMRPIIVNISPAVSAHQSVKLLLTLIPSPSTVPDPANPSGQYVLDTTPPQTDNVSQFSFATKGLPGGSKDLPSGSYLIRVQVDGVDSTPNFVAPSNGGGGFAGGVQQVTLP